MREKKTDRESIQETYREEQEDIGKIEREVKYKYGKRQKKGQIGRKKNTDREEKGDTERDRK